MRSLIEMFPADSTATQYQANESKDVADAKKDIYESIPIDPQSRYDVRDLISLLIDADSFDEYKAEYGQTIVCGYARIGGHAVGIVANQRTVVKSPKEGMQFGGVIYHDSADKEARFIMDCNQTWTPLIFLQDVMGFMVGRDSEQAGICLLYTSPSPRDGLLSRMPSSA